MATIRELQEFYGQGGNVHEKLMDDPTLSEEEKIEIIYDIRTGISTKYAQGKTGELREKCGREIASAIMSLWNPNTVLEAGTGEGTTLSKVMKSMSSNVHFYGFDLSWSRTFFARKFLEDSGVDAVSVLVLGSLFNIPFADSSIDVVYTHQTIEPNGGFEKQILQELYRVAKRYLILIEPAYELVDAKTKERMDKFKYCKNLKQTSELLGYAVLKHELFPVIYNPPTPTAITIIKVDISEPSDYILADPKHKTKLIEHDGVMYSEDTLTAYPIIKDIPCLRIGNGVLASKFLY